MYQVKRISDCLRITGARKYGRTYWFGGWFNHELGGYCVVSSHGAIRPYASYGTRGRTKTNPLDSWPGQKISPEKAVQLGSEFEIILPENFNPVIRDNGFGVFHPFKGNGYQCVCTLVLTENLGKTKEELLQLERVEYRQDLKTGLWCSIHIKTRSIQDYYFPGSRRLETRRNINPSLYVVEERIHQCAPRVTFFTNAESVVKDIEKNTNSRMAIYEGLLGVTKSNFRDAIKSRTSCK